MCVFIAFFFLRITIKTQIAKKRKEKEALENGNTGRLDERKSNIEEEVKSVTVKVLETGNTGGLNWRKLDNEGRYKQTNRQIPNTEDWIEGN